MTPPTSLSMRDLIIATAIAIGMASAFVTLSHGASLLVTFVPGLAFAWLVYVWMLVRRTSLPSRDRFLPIFFTALAIQFLHFAEEYVTGFRTFFPELYGGEPYSADLFVIFNMVSYAVFTLAALLVFYRGLNFLLLPVAFFIVYGAIGNAISHVWWSIEAQAYRPGLVTALAYWIAGPWLLFKLLGSRLHTAILVGVFAAVLIPLIALFAVR